MNPQNLSIIAKHPNYKYTSDYDPKNAFDVEDFLSHRLRLKTEDSYGVEEIDLSDFFEE